MKKKIIVVGPALSQTGYGEQCRFALRALMSNQEDFDVYLKPVPWGKSSWIPFDSEDRNWIDMLIRKTMLYGQSNGHFDASLQVTIPNEWEKVAPINIGYTAGIETTKVSPEWIEKSRLMDRIITISNHSKNVYLETSYDARMGDSDQVFKVRCETPIDVVHYGVRNHKQEDIKIDLDYDFNFLVVAQWGPRKNLENTVRWWIEEFKDEEVGLVVKTSLYKTSIIDKSINIIKTSRGGKITWHGPGQLICYVIVNLGYRKKDIRNFLNIIETSIINSLKKFGIRSYSDRKNIGIWTKFNKEEKKIGAIGIKVKKWITYHGFSININNNISNYKKIIPCGIKDKPVTTLKSIYNQKYNKLPEELIKNLISNL